MQSRISSPLSWPRKEGRKLERSTNTKSLLISTQCSFYASHISSWNDTPGEICFESVAASGFGLPLLSQRITPPSWGFVSGYAGHMLAPLCGVAATNMERLQGTAVNRVHHCQWEWLVKPPPCWSFRTSAAVGVWMMSILRFTIRKGHSKRQPRTQRKMMHIWPVFALWSQSMNLEA